MSTKLLGRRDFATLAAALGALLALPLAGLPRGRPGPDGWILRDDDR